MLPYNWANAAARLIHDHPDTYEEVIETALMRFHQEGTIFSSRDPSIEKFLAKEMEARPGEFWDLASKFLSPPLANHALDLWFWLGKTFGEENDKVPITLIPKEKIWDWIEEDVETRSWLVARFAPKVLLDEFGNSTLARDLLARYGENQRVRRELEHNFMSGMWWGPASRHFAGKRDALMDIRDREDNNYVKLFIDEVIERYDQMITQNRIREEREDF
jgi:hypothetical protein